MLCYFGISALIITLTDIIAPRFELAGFMASAMMFLYSAGRYLIYTTVYSLCYLYTKLKLPLWCAPMSVIVLNLIGYAAGKLSKNKSSI